METAGKSRRQWWLLLAVTVLIAVAVGVISHTYAKRYFLNETQARGEVTLRLAVASISSALERYERLPQLLADRTDIRRVLANPSGKALRDQLSIELQRINTLLGSSDIYVLDRTGLTLSASNHQMPTSFVGQSYSYRPYFSQALSGQSGQYYALGTMSLKRGYYFSAPVKLGADIMGVVTVKIAVDRIEDSWRGGDHLVLVTGDDDVVFMSGRPDLLYKSVQPLNPQRLATLESSRRYANAEITELGSRIAGQHQDVPIVQGELLGDGQFMVLTRQMAGPSWTVQVLASTLAAGREAAVVSAIAVLLVLLAGAGAALLMSRRNQLAERLRLQKLARDELEQRVDERTADLNAANAKLKLEVRERKQAEEELKRTQEDLVQAGKLAALGQMSAALSHEFNQPLAALKTYAENAGVFLQRGQPETAGTNLQQVLKLSDRLASISRRLRNFARKPDEKPRPVPVRAVVEETLEFLGARLREAGVPVRVDLPDEDLHVLAGTVRLQQVLMNVVSNAIDASEQAPERGINIFTESAGDETAILVRDHGPGVDERVVGRIFDPFFTTKGVGKGLGLGLSISYNIVKDFGGRLSVRNDPGGGALFRIGLKTATVSRTEAAE
jgi:two-component system C4-dicarboxylate transport sensor histidine kinase DctB